MRLIIVRHGETVENVAKIVQGWSCGTLNETGIQQAKKVAERLKNEKIDVCYSSDLERTMKTAQEIMKYHNGVQLIPEKALREKNSSIWEGKKREERDEFLKKHHLSLEEYKAEGGESIPDVQLRMVAFYNALVKKYTTETILLVSHGGSLTAFYLWLFKSDFSEFKKYHPENTAVTILEVDNDKKHTVHVLNCITHLR
jgi:probable phosphoglycerate mutase